MITLRGSDILCYPNESAYIKKIFQQKLPQVNRCIAVSKDIRNKAIEFGVVENKIEVLQDGILTQYFLWDETIEKLRQPNVILFAGNLIPVKNVLFLIDSFIELKKNEPVKKLKLKICGQGYQRQEMQDRISRAGLNSCVEFLGLLSGDQLAQEMQKATVLCLPSISEGSPNVIAEAMACGTPVIAARVGGIPEQITSDEYGYLFESNNQLDFIKKLTMALTKTSWEAKKISKNPIIISRNQNAYIIYVNYEKLLYNYIE